jgi:Holliday junction DNA helicase RuvA
MISMLHGILFEKSPGLAVIECGGVGYDVAMPVGAYNSLPSVGDECRVFVRHVVREDDEQLYGFASREERGVFDLLQGVSGVGPKLALSVLDGLSVQDFRRCVVNGDAKRLSAVKGVGKKTAERIVVELKGKIDPVEAMASGGGGAAPMDASLRDAILALSSLGFNQEVAYRMVQSAIDGGADRTNTEELIRAALAAR